MFQFNSNCAFQLGLLKINYTNLIFDELLTWMLMISQVTVALYCSFLQ